MPKTPPDTALDAPLDTSAKPGWRARLPFLIPLVVLGVLAVYFAIGLGKNPQELPSALIDRPVPAFDLPPIAGHDRGLTSDDIRGQVSLVNIFGSWCVACLQEHPFLMQLKANNVIPIYGIDWREENRSAGPAWLARHGDPYTLIGDDPNSRGAVAFGVTGAPETFIVDANGVIRYKHLGPITPDIWTETFAPIIAALRAGG